MQFAYEQPGFDLDYVQIFSSTSLPPVVTLINPTAGQTFTTGVDILLAVSASDPDGSIARVDYFANGNKVAQSTLAQLASYWRPPTPGTYAISARAVDNVGLSATSAPVTVRVETFVLGGLKREVYTNIPGGLLADLTNHVRFPNSPDLVEQVGQFESTPNLGDSYGARLSGWLIPPTTGNYKFYLASDDQGALFLSTDATAANKKLIALEPQWGPFREYTGNAGGRRVRRRR